ncbi:flavoprotein, HI0933 family [Campylobacter blaseri]|uniref:Aminoacetone oxidase family FAD-binding enzyme n=1 Tax=Campylobacter blaseri TaxID=2042961 RepID=A0A2P8R484_9BACT|nr:aminoacetone oxidase family FAD-binding enzyme [Campylobacter blaseri]PSM53289.1 aminoacetone oxidase family FAD-binding enzyme [Campylobacter blaseri]PSM54755.1 aminoacetone oxidase family FAD-binding enzyme [Campylobacter blaseri]QKF86763.1 flavoprotein, HI0933 family [Campylobacter blaseri]
MEFNTIIIGGGASALFLASKLNSQNVAILEKNSTVGKKILASGGGKCNITNEFINANNYLGNFDFISRILDNLSYIEVLDFFKELSFIKIKNNQFFCKNGSKEVLSFLVKKANKHKIFLNTEVLDVDKIDDVFLVKTKDKLFKCKNLVVASGGLSYSKLGVSDIGYKIALKFGHKVSKLNPALVGFTVQKDEFWFKGLSGVCFRAKVQVKDREFFDDILFTHKGISGPSILNASLFWEKGKIYINFLPNFKISNFKSSKKQISTLFPLPKRFIKSFLISKNLEDKQMYKLNEDEFEKLQKLQNYEFAPAGNFGFDRAEITKGGVEVCGIDENCQSKLTKNLFFIGEVLDVSGMLGGYNIHFAFASAKRVAKHLSVR